MKKYGASQPLMKTGQMLSLLSLKGVVDVEPSSIVIHYGIDEPPSRVFMPQGELSEQDKQITDRKKAEYNQDVRPFWGLDDRICQAIADLAGEAFTRLAKEIK